MINEDELRSRKTRQNNSIDKNQTIETAKEQLKKAKEDQKKVKENRKAYREKYLLHHYQIIISDSKQNHQKIKQKVLNNI